jgi:periplasmic divalent cation tolerance protein
MTEEGARIVFMMAPDMAVAEQVVRALLDEHLVACGNMIPSVTSVYRWEGAIQQETEVMVMLKTTERLTDAVIARIRAMHPYEVPEIVAVDIAAGLPEYLGWIRESTR